MSLSSIIVICFRSRESAFSGRRAAPGRPWPACCAARLASAAPACRRTGKKRAATQSFCRWLPAAAGFGSRTTAWTRKGERHLGPLDHAVQLALLPGVDGAPEAPQHILPGAAKCGAVAWGEDEPKNLHRAPQPPGCSRGRGGQYTLSRRDWATPARWKVYSLAAGWR